MKGTAHCSISLALSVAGLLMLASAVGAAPLVSLAPSPLEACGEFTIDVVVNDEVLGLTGYDLLIDFDETILSVVGVDEGALPAGYAGETFFYWTDSGTVSNALLINGAVLGGSIDGPGALASITFMGNADGSTLLDFLMVDCRDIDNVPIPMTHLDGQVAVDDETTVYVDPASSVEPIDIPFTVDIVLGAGVTSVSGVDLVLQYDDAIIELLGVSEGALLSGYVPH
ncbi:cohesin domain-containing protein, partial [bacterium]|nr:cohesin domain-containing protein [bacterium]